MPTRSSGDLLADRRYAYAEAALASGDAVAAADLAEQVLELAPRYAPAWFLLGRARERLAASSAGSSAASSTEPFGAPGAAARAFATALALDPDDAQGARLALARLGGGDPLGAVTAGYVRALFEEYAPRFERHLVEGLAYRGPALIRAAVLAAAAGEGRAARFARALDLGCGTGLTGRALADLCGRIEGVDLSPAMLERARAGGGYTRLVEGDLAAFLAAEAPASADLIVAADVFIYVGRLGPVLAACARALAPGGLLAFTVQARDPAGGGESGEADGDGLGAVLGVDARYAHRESALRRRAVALGLRVVAHDPAAVRRERGLAVPGWVMVWAR